MSGLVGVYHLDGRPVDVALLRRMTAVIAHRGPDGAGHWIDGPVGLGHAALRATPESLRETQPLADETGALCLALDGRVDNRDELAAALKAEGARLRDDTDAELVLRAYERWEERCPERILGDFAFVIWDRRHRRLFCARDPLGLKPFYYHTDGRTFRWASEPRPLFEDTTVAREPNEGMIGEYLADEITSRNETLYRDVYRLPPAHLLLVGPGGVRIRRYWDVDPARTIRYRTDAEYAEHLAVVFREAVRCRLRSRGPVGVALSGGLDSSAVLGVAQSLVREGAVADAGLEAFSMRFPGLPCDEGGYIEDVLRMWGVKSHAVRVPAADAACYAEQARRYHDFPDYPNGAVADPLKALAREQGVRVLLTGFGGDEWLSGHVYHTADLLRRFRVLGAIRQTRLDSRVDGIVLPALPVLRLGLWPLLPDAARLRIRRALGRARAPGWIDGGFARRIRLTERLDPPADRRFPTVAQEQIYRIATGGTQVHGDEIEERATSRFGIEQRHPFNDRRVLEFALAIPEEQRWRGDQPKFLLRQAMRAILPQTVRQRATKAEFSVLFVKALQAQGGGRLFEALATAPLGWLDLAHVRRMYRRMAELYARGDERYTRFVGPLWMIFGIDLWFKTVFSGGEAAPLASPRVHERSIGTG